MERPLLVCTTQKNHTAVYDARDQAARRSRAAHVPPAPQPSKWLFNVLPPPEELFPPFQINSAAAHIKSAAANVCPSFPAINNGRWLAQIINLLLVPGLPACSLRRCRPVPLKKKKDVAPGKKCPKRRPSRARIIFLGFIGDSQSHKKTRPRPCKTRQRFVSPSYQSAEKQ